MPEVVLIPWLHAGNGHPSTGHSPDVHASAHRSLAVLQRWLGDPRFADSRLIFLTRRAISTETNEGVLDLAAAPLWGLVRAAQVENADRMLTIVDLDGEDVSLWALPAALACDEPQLALREGMMLAPRLACPPAVDRLTPPTGSATWHLTVSSKGTIDNLTLAERPQATGPLGPDEVRIAVRAAGLEHPRRPHGTRHELRRGRELGIEAAGQITEVGSRVRHLKVGERVMGLMPAAFGPITVTDSRLVAKMPESWSFEQAAAVPLAFLTAYYALVGLGKLDAGKKVLIHAATGGGHGRHAAGSPSRRRGVRNRERDEVADHARSRLRRRPPRQLAHTRIRAEVSVGHGWAWCRCRAQQPGQPDLIDASLRLMPEGGHFLEMGKTDVREPDRIASAYRRVNYRSFDPLRLEPDLIQAMFTKLSKLSEDGDLKPLPISSWDIRKAPDAFRFLQQAKHVGKVVFDLPRGFDPEGTVMITGGTGALGAMIARHLIERRRAAECDLIGGSAA